MGTQRSFGVGVVALVGGLLGACEGPTGIRVDVTMSSALLGQLDPDARDFDTLRIYVGHPTTEAQQFTSAESAFLTEPSNEELLQPGFRYLLEPRDGELGSIMLAAAVGRTPPGGRFEIFGFAAAPVPTAFAAGEVRIIELALMPDSGAESGADDECIRWDQDTQIAPMTDRDCDGAIGDADCDDRDPARNLLDSDHDGITSCAGDCMEFPRSDLPWVDPAEVFPGSTHEANAGTCNHVDYNCNGNCGVAAIADTDGTGTTACGRILADDLVCAPTPADCDEQRPGHNPAPGGAGNVGEACNGRDDNCDTFLPPPLPCTFRDSNNKCHVGTVLCDEVEGEYAGEHDAMIECKPGGGFSGASIADPACSVDLTETCRESPDPVACATEGQTAIRVACPVNARGGTGQICRPDRKQLTAPGGFAQCQWFVVGGLRQAEWEVGFVDANAAPDTVPTPSSTQCSPHLSVKAVVPDPAPRSVLLLVTGPQGTLQPVILQLRAGAALCTGAMDCTGPGAILGG